MESPLKSWELVFKASYAVSEAILSSLMKQSSVFYTNLMISVRKFSKIEIQVQAKYFCDAMKY